MDITHQDIQFFNPVPKKAMISLGKTSAEMLSTWLRGNGAGGEILGHPDEITVTPIVSPTRIIAAVLHDPARREPHC